MPHTGDKGSLVELNPWNDMPSASRAAGGGKTKEAIGMDIGRKEEGEGKGLEGKEERANWGRNLKTRPGLSSWGRGNKRLKEKPAVRIIWCGVNVGGV